MPRLLLAAVTNEVGNIVQLSPGCLLLKLQASLSLDDLLSLYTIDRAELDSDYRECECSSKCGGAPPSGVCDGYGDCAEEHHECG
ncbi:hypothetical protein N869_05745 [Cellulomonas bogoriensis 69B4 = DSM 16987]|uniref:Uncharacterized protein n=1 Tax=Cellulomonas bogoriensis 69B4 = DSM 16987 TaxID=1386082 RepID=A0A0A0BR71_9CELL|nr:hypothetical protein N869_05745 [Cellulomonas bogoriensis 69B4 = DSM 16987]